MSFKYPCGASADVGFRLWFEYIYIILSILNIITSKSMILKYAS